MAAGSRHRKSAQPGPAAAGSTAIPLAGWIEANRGKLLVTALAANFLLCLLLFDPKPHTGGDNAAYVLLARSILTVGDGYTLGISPTGAEPHTQYPFGFPLLLAPAVAVFDANFVALKLYMTLFSLGLVWVFSLLAARLAGPLVRTCATLAVALNPITVEYAHWVLSELPFAFFSILTLYLLQRAETDQPDKYGAWFWAGIAALAFTVHIRTAGASFAVAGVVYYLLRRKWKRLALFTVTLAVLVTPWMIRNRLAAPAGDIYVNQLLLKNPYTPEQGRIDLAGLAGRIRNNFKVYTFSEMGRTVIHERALTDLGGGVRLVAGLLTLLVLTGLVLRLVSSARFVDYFVLVYLAVVLIWPEVWSDVRFIMALIPLFLLYCADAASWLAGRAGVSRMGGEKAAAWLICIIALAGLYSQVRLLPGNLQMLTSYLAGDRYAGYPENWRHLFEAAEWAKDNSDPQDSFVVRKPTLFALVSGRRAESYPFTTDTDSVLAVVLRNDYAVVDAVSGTTGRYLIPALMKQQKRFKLVFDRPYAKVVEVRP